MLIARKDINKASFKPFQEMVIKPSFTISSPPAVRGIVIRKNITKSVVHFRCFSTKTNGILDIKTKVIAMINPRQAGKSFGRRAMETIRKEKETIFILGSQEWNIELRFAYLSISGRCILQSLLLFTQKVKNNPGNSKDIADPAYHFSMGYLFLL